MFAHELATLLDGSTGPEIIDVAILSRDILGRQQYPVDRDASLGLGDGLPAYGDDAFDERSSVVPTVNDHHAGDDRSSQWALQRVDTVSLHQGWDHGARWRNA